ncbi:MAG: DUF3577 domain-containing protein [Candidatus Accumulibacter sp.]|jgi:hypothetical protein|nr:DUF3577 domain-containing protein [Accumulibacter sp.]
MSTTTTPAKEKSHFDLHVIGIGYLHRIREVTPEKGNPYLACDVSALNGPKNKVSYVRFDCIVSGKDAQHLVKRCMPSDKAKAKILIGFKLGDLWTDIYTRTKGDNAGKPAVALKARLLFISWIKIDSKLKYQAEPRPEAGARAMDDPVADETPTEPADIGDEAPAEAPAPDEDESF